jgi:hypothetical protein
MGKLKLKKVALKAKTFIYCETKDEAKNLLKLAKKDLSLSFLHEKSTAVMEYEPDADFFEKNKKDCYYSLYYRKRANKEIVESLDGNIVKFKDAIKEKKE